jgi:hypothetical protein
LSCCCFYNRNIRRSSSICKQMSIGIRAACSSVALYVGSSAPR